MSPLFAIRTAVLCLAASGCVDFAALDSARQARVDAGPPDQKKFTELANTAAQTVKLSGAAEVSPLHAAHPPQGGDWMFCMKGSGANEKATYAVFIRDNAILDVRSGVIIDGCNGDTYRPLAAP
jgi:hypothetical protein